MLDTRKDFRRQHHNFTLLLRDPAVAVISFVCFSEKQQFCIRALDLAQIWHGKKTLSGPHILWYSIIFYLTIYCGILSGIYSDTLSGILPDNLLWHSIWHYIWHSILTFFLAVYVTFYSDIISGSISDILFRHSFWHLCWHSLWHGPFRAVPSEIWCLRFRTGSAHWDLDWLRKDEEDEEKEEKEKVTLMKSRDPHLAGREKDSLRPPWKLSGTTKQQGIQAVQDH